jgi:hypothetical protein
MDTLLSILFFLLSLAGVDVGGTTYVTRATSDGATSLESRAEVKSGVARFECIRSDSGRCHYTVLPRECARRGGRAAWPVGRCPAPAVRRFSIEAGKARDIAGLGTFGLCVDSAAGAPCAAAPGTRGVAAMPLASTR